MNAAVKAAPSEAAVPASPEEHLDRLALEMAGICKRLVARVAAVESENIKVRVQLRDALDAVEEMRGQLRTKDEVISELQALVGTERGRAERALGRRSET